MKEILKYMCMILATHLAIVGFAVGCLSIQILYLSMMADQIYLEGMGYALGGMIMGTVLTVPIMTLMNIDSKTKQ